MEAGFFHPDKGYWQVLEKKGYKKPAGAIEVPLRPSANHQWQDGAWVEVLPTAAEIAAQESLEVEATKERLAQPRSVELTNKKALFILDKRVRALEGKPEITWEQFSQWYDGQIEVSQV